jgi:hypothetical protein
LQEDGFQVGVAQRDGIALHAAGGRGLGGDLAGVLRPMPNAARPGTASWVRVCRIQASPSWIEAAGWPVSSRAVRS